MAVPWRLDQGEPVNIGPLRRIIEVEPVSIPVPEEIGEPARVPEPAREPGADPQPSDRQGSADGGGRPPR
ncbi:MAG TPA: hypothetical protein VE669_00975 [Actinomycetota bacterium]|nr:hypothetical protein [Actinomycetota bacterium]